VTFSTKEDWSGGGELLYEKRLYLVIHELGHALGFNNYLFGYYIDPNTGERLTNTTM